MSFEEDMGKLQTIVNQLERGNVPLEEALKKFQEGMKLSNKLQITLDKAEKTLTHVINEEGNEVEFKSDED